MANFDTANTKRESIKQANNLLDHVRSLYASGVQIQTLLALYQAGTDPAFNAAINAIYTAPERQELAVMLAQINSLVTDWTANHAGAVGA
jgi:hypothetical protein